MPSPVSLVALLSVTKVSCWLAGAVRGEVTKATGAWFCLDTVQPKCSFNEWQSVRPDRTKLIPRTFYPLLANTLISLRDMPETAGTIRPSTPPWQEKEVIPFTPPEVFVMDVLDVDRPPCTAYGPLATSPSGGTKRQITKLPISNVVRLQSPLTAILHTAVITLSTPP